MSNHIDNLVQSLGALSHDDRVKLVEKLAAGLGPTSLNAASGEKSLRMRKLNASMNANDTGLRNTLAELKRLGIDYSYETGVSIPSMSAATAGWSPERRIELKAKCAACGLLD